MNMLLLFLLAGCAFVNAQEHEIVYPRMIVSRSGEKQVLFRAFNQDFHLRLEPTDTISDDFVLATRDDNGDEVFLKPNVEHLRNTILQDPIIGATIFVDDSRSLTIKGIINDKLRIEPDPNSHYKGGHHGGHSRKKHDDLREGAEQKREPMEDVPHRVTKIADRLKDSAFYQDEVIPPGVKENSSDTINIDSRADETIVEVSIILDIQHSKRFTTNDECTAYHGVLLNAVNLRYKTMKKTKLKLVLVSLKRNFKDTDQPYIKSNTIQGHADPIGTLTDFANYCTKNQFYCKGDIVKLITTQPLGELDEHTGKMHSGTIGIAYVGGVCDAYYKCGISEDDACTFSGVSTFAHEVAHLLGCPHDGEDPVSYIPGSPGTKGCPWEDGQMMSYIAKDERQYAFSWCCDDCVSHLLTLRSSACLRENKLSVINNQSDHRLPGQYLQQKWGISDIEAYYNMKCHLMRDDWYFYKVNLGKCLDGYFCRTASEGGYFYYWKFDSGDGDPCDTYKICKNGYCVPA